MTCGNIAGFTTYAACVRDPRANEESPHVACIGAIRWLFMSVYFKQEPRPPLYRLS